MVFEIRNLGASLKTQNRFFAPAKFSLRDGNPIKDHPSLLNPDGSLKGSNLPNDVAADQIIRKQSQDELKKLPIERRIELIRRVANQDDITRQQRIEALKALYQTYEFSEERVKKREEYTKKYISSLKSDTELSEKYGDISKKWDFVFYKKLDKQSNNIFKFACLG